MDLFLLQGFSYWVTLPEGPHGMVEAAARKRRCPAPTRALAGARASGCGTNLTRVGHCQAKSCPGQPGASLAKPLTAGKNREQGAGWPPPCCSLKCFPVPAFGRACPAPSTQHVAAGMKDQHDQHKNGEISKGKKHWDEGCSSLGDPSAPGQQPQRKICSQGPTSLSSGGG